VRVSSVTAADITQDEIKQTPNVHLERANYPLWSADPFTGIITFKSALPKIHTGAKPKKVFAEFYEPEFSEVDLAAAFVPPETTHSVSSTQVYGQSIGASSSSLNQGSFTAYLEDGVTDPLVTLKNQQLFFRFYPDKNKSPHLLCNGILGMARTFPADNLIQGSFTVSSQYAAVERES